MALTIFPASGYDSFITVADADTIITANSVQSATWLALTEVEKEVYLRIATINIMNVVSTDTDDTYYLDETTYVYADSCLPKTCALMGVYDLVYGLSAEINPNLGTITKEKVGDLEVNYQHDYKSKGRKTSPYQSSVRPCLESYGAVFYNGFSRATLERS